ARTTNVAQQKLQYRCSTNELDTGCMLRPTNRICKTGGTFTPGVFGDRVCQILEAFFRYPACLTDHFWGIPRVVTFEDLENGPRILQRLISLVVFFYFRATTTKLISGSMGFMTAGNVFVRMRIIIGPSGGIINASFRIIARKQPVQILSILKVLAHYCRGVGIGQNVVFEPQVVTQHIVNQSADERNV